jgi:arginase
MPAPIRIIGIPMDLGQALRGVDMGPGAVRYAGLKSRLERLGYEVEDTGNIDVPVRDEMNSDSPPYFLSAVTETCGQAYKWALDTRADDAIPIFLGGDHSISIGTVGGVTHGGPCGVLWIDAHADFNTPETSPSGNIHGMPLASLVGIGPSELVNLGRKGPKVRAKDVVIVGARDVDISERRLLKEAGVCVYTMRDIDERGMATVMREAVDRLTHMERLHVSLDLDSLDPSEAPGVGTPVPGGLTYREAQLAMEMLADTKRVQSVDVVEVNPILDKRNETGVTAVELLESLFGKSIL